MKKKIVAWFLLLAIMIALVPAGSVQAAEENLYLAYQNTETGKPVVQLKGASAKAVYKVTELNMSKGDKVDLCFINASFWENAKWTSDNEKVATVNSDGVITAVGDGVAKVTLTYRKTFSNKTVSASVKVYVGNDNWKLHIGTTANDIPESRELKIGRKLDLAFWGVSDWNSGKLFDVTWMSSDEGIVSTDKSTGVITAVKPGTAKIGISLFNKASNIAINDIIEVKVLPRAFSDSTWQNENYLTYGENYFRLFSGDYMFRIPGSVIDKHIVKEYGRIAETSADGAITDNYYTAISKLNGLDKFLMGTFEFLQNGTTIAVDAVLGGEDTYEEAKAYACVLRFVEELHKNENSVSSIVFDTAETTDVLNSIYEEAVDLSKSEMIDALGDSRYLSETEIKELVDELYANYDMIGDLVSEGVTITEYIGSVIKLHEIDEGLLYSLSQCADADTTLGNALEVLYRERSKNEVSVCAEKYLSDKAADVINDIISEGTGGVSTAIIKAAGKVEEVLHLDMDSYYAAVEFGCYQAELRFYCKDLLKEINANYSSYTEEELKDKIEEYEFAYEAYITASRMMLEETLKIAKSTEKSKVQASINALKTFDYNSAVDLAMKYFKADNPNADEKKAAKPVASEENSTTETISSESVQQKMDNLCQLLGNKYCTVNQKACLTERESPHGCTNCNMRDITKTSWFTNLFGKVNVDNFPEHDVNSSRRDNTGQSCFGFACFAQWYVYADSLTEKVESERVATVKFNKTNMQKYVQPGDVIRVNGHSILVYSVEENGLMVIDSNWNMGGQLNCIVQKHLIPYTNKYCAGYTAYINRVEGTVTEQKPSTTTPNPTVTPNPNISSANKLYGTVDLSATTWSSYNVGLDKDMYADKAYNIKNNAKLEILGEYTNAKGNKVYHVYSYDLKMECYIGAKYVRVDYSDKEMYGKLDLSAAGWSSYNAGMDKNMNADKAYTIPNGGKVKILAKHVSNKGNYIYELYSYDLEMVCYVAAKYVKVD